MTPITDRGIYNNVGFLLFLNPTSSGEIEYEIRWPARSNKIRPYRDSPHVTYHAIAGRCAELLARFQLLR